MEDFDAAAVDRRMVRAAYLDADTPPEYAYFTETAARGYRAQHTLQSQAKYSGTKLIEELRKVGVTPWWSQTRDKGNATVVVDHGHAIAFLTYRTYDRLTISVSAATPDHAISIARQYLAWLPDPPDVDEEKGTLSIRFWYNHLRGASNWTKDIEVPAWDSIRQNYPNAAAMDALLEVSAPEGQGKLILWHGAAGTGKTYAVRSLAWGWRKWCTPHYISDPEAFFNDASYMMSVLMGGADGIDEDDYIGDYGDYAQLSDESENAVAHKWKLLICEDVGELMYTDAKDRSGQALSRVLNLTEGLIGQGLKVLLLFTTNEKMSDLHPAVSRPGRCLNEIEFRAFSEDEAQAWLEGHGFPDALDGAPNRKAVTLAELYNITDPKMVGPRRRRAHVGFRHSSVAHP